MSIFWNSQPKAKGGQKGKGGGKGANAAKTRWNCGEHGHMSSQCPKKKVHCDGRTHHCESGRQSRHNHGRIGRKLLRCWQEVTLEPRGAGEKICSMDAPNVHEGESVDIEIDSGAEVSCLPVNIGADTNPLHETRLSMCGGHHVAAVAANSELGARILGLEAANVRGDVVNLLVRFRVMNIGKALLSTQDLSRCGWETVFLAGCGDAYLVRKASDTSITLVKKRCAWYLRVKLKPHSELPYSEGEEFLEEVMSMDQRAGVWLVEEGGGSSNSGPAVPEDVEESELVKKLVAPTAPTATDREELTASGHAAPRTWCRECCIGRGRMHQLRAGGRETAIPAIAIDCGYWNERDDLLQEAAGAPIQVSECNRDRWIGAAIVPTKGADEYAVAELKNDVIYSGFTEVLVRSDNEPAIFGSEGVSSDSVEIGRCA